jgi:hypothetical protein
MEPVCHSGSVGSRLELVFDTIGKVLSSLKSFVFTGVYRRA